MLKLKCQTDFVAKTEEFNILGNDLCLQIAFENPLYISKNDISRKDFYHQQDTLARATMIEMADGGIFKVDKQELLEKIVDGKLEKWYKKVCLLEQIFIKNEKIIIKNLLTDVSIKTGEKIEITEFVRLI